MGSPVLEYLIEAAEPVPIIQSFSTLRFAGFDMTQVTGARTRVPRSRTVRARNDPEGYAAPQLNLQTREGDWFRRDFGNVYTMDQDVLNTVLAIIGTWTS